MCTLSRHRLLPILLAAAVLWSASLERGGDPHVDRILVAWVANAVSTQWNVSPLTIQDGPAVFDGWVYVGRLNGEQFAPERHVRMTEGKRKIRECAPSSFLHRCRC